MTSQPKTDDSEERNAFRAALDETKIYMLLFYGSDSGAFFVERDKAPPTEFPLVDETIVYVDWESGEDYALSVYRGEGIGTQMEEIENPRTTVSNRNEVIEEIKAVFEE